MPALSLDHWNIYCKDLGATVRFYERYVGLTDGDRPPFSFPGAWLYAGDTAVVHLVEVAETARPSAGSSLDHFAFAIDDYDDAKRRLEKAGIAYRSSEPAGSDIRQLFVTEANGVTFELNYRGARAG